VQKKCFTFILHWSFHSCSRSASISVEKIN